MSRRLNVLLGGDGLLGQAMSEKLTDAGEEVLSLDLKRGHDLRVHSMGKYEPGTYVWFLAWDVGGAKYIMDSGEQLNILKSNVRLCELVFEELQHSQLEFTFVSTQMIDYRNAYGVTKRLGEYWADCIPSGKIARLWNIYDAEEPSRRSHVVPDLISQGRSGRINLLTTGDERRQFLHAGDCCDALLLQRDIGQRVADITTGHWVPVLHVAKIIANRFGAKVAPGSRPGYESLIEPSSPLAGWRPRLTLEEGLQQVITKMERRGWL